MLSPRRNVVPDGVPVAESLAIPTTALAMVKAFVLLAEPSNELPALVTSPVVIPMVRDVANTGAPTCQVPLPLPSLVRSLLAPKVPPVTRNPPVTNVAVYSFLYLLALHLRYQVA